MYLFSYYQFKNIVDRLFSFFILLIFSPLFLLISLMVLIFLGRPIFFKQERPGMHNKLFTLYKFRTMNIIKDKTISPHDQSRINFFGNFLRKTSLDELPQIYNIFLGEMSFIGPRPLLKEYLALYSQEQIKRHLVKPGISGWAQVNGRNSLSWEDKFKMDIWYVKNQKFLLDLKIIIFTLFKIFKSSEINASYKFTSMPFQGNKK